MQFFARGVFAWPAITGFRGQQGGFIGNLRMQGWAVRALTLSALDWPLRRLTHGNNPRTWTFMIFDAVVNQYVDCCQSHPCKLAFVSSH